MPVDSVQYLHLVVIKVRQMFNEGLTEVRLKRGVRDLAEGASA